MLEALELFQAQIKVLHLRFLRFHVRVADVAEVLEQHQQQRAEMVDVAAVVLAGMEQIPEAQRLEELPILLKREMLDLVEEMETQEDQPALRVEAAVALLLPEEMELVMDRQEMVVLEH